MYQDDKRIVITLDAGGTNFVFGAMRGNRFIGETITYPSNSDDLDKCLQTMIGGFREVIASLPQAPCGNQFRFHKAGGLCTWRNRWFPSQLPLIP